MRKILYSFCVILSLSFLISCGNKAESTGDITSENRITTQPGNSSIDNDLEATDQPSEKESDSLAEPTSIVEETLSNSEDANSEVYYPVGIDISEFIERFNEAIADCDGYQIDNLNIVAGEKYNTFEYKFPNSEVLSGLVNKDGDFLYLEYNYPAKSSSDQNITYARQMVCASAIMAFTQNSATTDIAVEQSTAIMKQLTIIKDDTDIYNKYVAEELLMAVCDGIKYTRQLDKTKDISCFTLSAANEDKGETETVNITYDVTSAIKDAEDIYNSTESRSDLNEYQKQAMDYYLGGQKEIPSGWIEYQASIAWLLDDIANGYSIYHDGKYYTPEARIKALSIVADNGN